MEACQSSWIYIDGTHQGHSQDPIQPHQSADGGAIIVALMRP